VTPEEWNLEGLAMRFRQLFGFDPQLTPPDGREPLPLEEELRGQVLTEYACREASLAEEIRAAHLASGTSENTSIDYSRIARRRVHGLEMISMLRAADEKWIDHLYSMDYLRESVRLRAYGQKDPLVEYKSEGFEMFQAMMKTIDENVTQSLFRLTDPEIRRNREAQIKRGTFDPSEDPLAQLSQSQYNRVMADKTQDRSFAAFDTSRFALAGQPSHAMQAGRQQGGPREDGGKTAPKSVPVVRNLPKVNPNDKCPCGSGKKFKKCCGALAEN
jgi:preprotein translocase subunit SecA